MLFLLALVVLKPSARASEGSWNTIYAPVSNDLFDVFMIDAYDGWMVGDAGTVLHWNGISWTPTSSPTTEDLQAVCMLNSTDGWAVGLNGVTIHWDGVNWTIVNTGVAFNLLDVAATDYPYYYAVGANGTILKWDGMSWSFETIPNSAGGLRGIDMWWEYDLTPPYGQTWHGLAVGDGGVILNYTETTGWSKLIGPTTEQLNKVYDTWIVGSHCAMIRWSGRNWVNATCPKTGYGYLNTVNMINVHDGWTMGYEGTILHWDGTEWTEASSPTSNSLNSVFMVNTYDGWAVGNDGTIIHWNGTQWIPEFPEITLALALATVFLALVKAEQVAEKSCSEPPKPPSSST